MKLTFTFLFLIFLSAGIAQISTFYVEPFDTDNNYALVQDSHLVVRNSATNVNKLFLFIGGTGSHTSQMQTISNFAGNLGYDVINLSYINDVAAASLANSSDSMVFNKFRQEVCFGTDVSPDVAVDSLNSIFTRTVKLLNYLVLTYPGQNWGQYLVDSETLDWSKIAVAGHSQGGGHACYLAKFQEVERVLMLSSPNDYSDYFSNAANWLRMEGVTPVNKHFAYLSILDELVDFDKQLQNLQALNLFPTYDSTHVDNSSSPYNNSHFLYTDQSPGITILYHNSTLKFSAVNNAVWTYMLTSTLPTNKVIGKHTELFEIFPNPTNSQVNVLLKGDLTNIKVNVTNSFGQTVLTKNSQTEKIITMNFTDLDSGIYFISLGNQISKILKY